MKSIRWTLLAVVLAAGNACAQDSDSVDWKIAPYLWGVSIDGTMTVGQYEQDLDVSFSDILDNLDFGGSIFAEVGKGHHAFSFDYTYLRLEPDDTELPSPPTPSGSTMSTKMTINILEPAYNYRLDGLNSTAIVVGARYIDMSIKLTPNINGPDLPIEGPFPQDPLKTGPSWWDAFVGIKTHNRIGEKWDFQFYGTVGYGQSDFPWTLQAVFARRFNNGNRLGFGARIWSLDYTEDNPVAGELANLDAKLTGLMIGYEFN